MEGRINPSYLDTLLLKWENKPMDIQKKMYRSLGHRLIHEGVVMTRKASDIKRIEHSKQEIKDFLANIGITGVSLYDSRYYTCSWSVWQEFIQQTFIQLTKYESDKMDCDKYAKIFYALSNWTMKVNTGGLCCGPIYSKESGNGLGNHCFNLILTEDFGEIKPILFEPMTDNSCNWQGQKTALDKWKYGVNWASY